MVLSKKKPPYFGILGTIFCFLLLAIDSQAKDSIALQPEIKFSKNSDQLHSKIQASDSLLFLKEGNAKYTAEVFQHRLAHYHKNNPTPHIQHPHSIILSCSDSRVPPTLIFDQGLGETFSVRDAGEVPGIAVIGSIEYAVEHLGTPLLVVMGHTDCGAIKAALSATTDHPAQSPSLQAVITEIRDNLGNITLKTASPHFKKEAFLNAKEVARDLLKRSDIIKTHVKTGKLTIVPAVYDLETGHVEFGESISSKL